MDITLYCLFFACDGTNFFALANTNPIGWKEREVFGKIRFMNYNGCKRKFKIDTFVGQYDGALKNSLEASKKHGKSKDGPPTTKKQRKS